MLPDGVHCKLQLLKISGVITYVYMKSEYCSGK